MRCCSVTRAETPNCRRSRRSAGRRRSSFAGHSPGSTPSSWRRCATPRGSGAGANICRSSCCACFRAGRSNCCCGRSSTSGPPGFPGRKLHDVYRFAQSRGLLHDALPVNRCHSPSAVDTTPEREYIHVLLQDLLNGGHFPPQDAFWVSQNLPRWSGALALEPSQGRNAEPGFVVDPDGEAGLVRSSLDAPAPGLGLDTASFLGDDTRPDRVPARCPRSSERGSVVRTRTAAQTAAQTRRTLLAGTTIGRTSGRAHARALTVEVAVGLPQILRTLRHKPEVAVAAAPGTEPAGEGITITGYDGSAEDSTDGNTITQWSPSRRSLRGTPPLTMVDHSDSGCRMHGPTLDTNPIMPGTLIAFRESAATPWTLGVVRRVRKRLAGNGSRSASNTSATIRAGSSPSCPIPTRAPNDCPAAAPALRGALSFSGSGESGGADQDTGPAGMRAGVRGSPFHTVAHVRVHDPAEGAARRAGRLHLVAVRCPRTLAEGRAGLG